MGLIMQHNQGSQSLSARVIITIIFYFENAASFNAKLGSDVIPRVDNQNQTSGDTLQQGYSNFLFLGPHYQISRDFWGPQI